MLSLFCLEVSLGQVRVILNGKAADQFAGYGLVFQFLDFQPIILECKKRLCNESHCIFDVYKGKSCILEAAVERMESDLQATPEAVSILLVSGLDSTKAGKSLQLIASSCATTNYGDDKSNSLESLDLHDQLGQVSLEL
jgi:hypothetical protein